MNYGYEPDMPGFDKKKVPELAKRLQALVLEYGSGERFSGAPYVEVNGLYPGVRLRKLTNLSEEKLRELTARADAIYKEVMRVK